MLEQEKDWTVLPPELIQIIANKLSDILDFIRFRAACKIWLSSTPLSDSPSQVPWLLELSESKDYHCLSVRPRFYSVSSCQTVTICLNQSKTLWTLINGGVFSHYLVSTNIKEETLSFFNPLNRGQFLLPWPRIGLDIPWMFWRGPDPIGIRSIVVVNQNLWQFWNEMGRWACYDPHNNKWVEQQQQQDEYLYSICYWQGMVFSTSAGRETEVFDASSKKLLHKIPPPDNERRIYNLFDKGDLAWLLITESYLVESLGIVLRVSWFSDWENYIAEDSIFHIYKLEFDGSDGQACWVRIDNIGNQVLFLDEMSGFSMTARPSTGFRENCIYFINPYEDKPYVHDILAGTVERLPCPFKKCTWFLPSLLLARRFINQCEGKNGLSSSSLELEGNGFIVCTSRTQDNYLFLLNEWTIRVLDISHLSNVFVINIVSLFLMLLYLDDVLIYDLNYVLVLFQMLSITIYGIPVVFLEQS